jgi:hypothetical protein
MVEEFWRFSKRRKSLLAPLWTRRKRAVLMVFFGDFSKGRKEFKGAQANVDAFGGISQLSVAAWWVLRKNVGGLRVRPNEMEPRMKRGINTD